jgi:hypothetical protein
MAASCVASATSSSTVSGGAAGEGAGKNYRQTRALLEQYPDMGGIYNIGGASDGVRGR